jgi:hypothetical protein
LNWWQLRQVCFSSRYSVLQRQRQRKQQKHSSDRTQGASLKPRAWFNRAAWRRQVQCACQRCR